MSGSDFSDRLRLFLYQYIDSVELIEVLLFLRSQAGQWLTSEQLSRELRSNPGSVSSRLEMLHRIGLIEEKDDHGSFCYSPRTDELKQIVDLLSEEYKVRRHKVLEMIFSTSKQARDFANAFVIGKEPGKKGDSHG